MSSDVPREDPDDLFAHTRMSLGDHIEDLRNHLLRAIMGFLVALVVGFFLGEPVLQFIERPVRRELERFWDERIKRQQEEFKKGNAELTAANEKTDITLYFLPDQLAKLRGVTKVEETEPVAITASIEPVAYALATAAAMRLVGRPPALTTLTVTEAFMVYFKVSIYCGIVLSSPWLFYQIWSFVAAGLYPHEKRYVNVYGPLSLGLFLGGVFLCEFVVLPIGIHYLLSFNEWLGVEPDLRLSEWLSFAILMPVIFGAAFQTPLVMLFLERIGLFSVDTYQKNRRMAMFVLALIAALLAVSPDAISMLSMAVPMWFLYEFGIILCRMSPRPVADLDADDEELVEV
jgi:sec-independent protein translocase protein TatC